MDLTERQAYDAMCLFLHEYWERGNRSSDDLAGLLSGLNRGLSPDGGSADPAMDQDWTSCVERIRAGVNPHSGFVDS